MASASLRDMGRGLCMQGPIASREGRARDRMTGRSARCGQMANEVPQGYSIMATGLEADGWKFGNVSTSVGSGNMAIITRGFELSFE